MSQSDSDSDTPGDIHEILGLPTISTDDKSPTKASENDKHPDNENGLEEHKSVHKGSAFNKFRDQGKDLIAKTERK